MDDNYWKDKTKISINKDEKFKLLEYEISMFRDTCNQLQSLKNSTNPFFMNLLIESLAIHSRVLIGFFYPENEQKKYLNDLIAQDFLPNINWSLTRPVLTDILQEARNKADKQLAHLSVWRFKLSQDNKKHWNPVVISRDLEKVIEEFYKLIDEDVKVVEGEEL